MTDQDYIRKAVELADGWAVNKTGQTITSGGGYFGKVEDQEIQDALAAQLVRQIDALDTKFVLMDGHGLIIIQDVNTIGDAVCRVEGPDRTMNTLKAIVDSGVLNKESK